ncbi:MAG TPA: dockerin type I repeat-containing protein [Candidatus Paceibacterota bacterium]|nr:dockerin type I repeat-containing protein [Candidatus Paceibacterota bacterium]
MRASRSIAALSLLMLTGAFSAVSAQEYSSVSYRSSNPVIFPAGYGTSPSFGLSGVVSQAAIGPSDSASYGLFSGFEYFPLVSTPIVAATPDTAAVNLSWTASEASNGLNVTSYSVGQSVSPGGPYTMFSLGNALSSSQSGLAPGIRYYFIIKVFDALGNQIATSTEVSAIPTAPSTTGGGSSGGGSGGGGGGGGTGYTSPSGSGSGVNFSGRAYPKSTVTILKDATVITTTVADATANFKVSVSNLGPGNYFFSVYSEDDQGRRSSLLTFPASVTSGVTTNIGGIFITPTIALDKSEVKRGDDIAIFGQTAQKGNVTIQVNSDQTMFVTTDSDAGGVYLYNFDTTPLELGDHSAKSKTSVGNEITAYSAAVGFIVGTQNVLAAAPTKACNVRGNLNADCKVNLVDYSILAYWFKRPNPPKNVDLNGDGKVDLIDFSILAYNWTG